MLHLLYRFAMPLAQVAFDDVDPPTPPPEHHRLSFGDLQKGLQDTNVGTAHDRHFQYILFAMIGVIAVIAMILHLRQRQKNAGPLNSSSKLARELSRKIHFPFGTRLLLGWVARTVELPMATLLISARAFDKAIDAWAEQHTFGVIRRWGHGRLKLLKPILFEEPPDTAEIV